METKPSKNLSETTKNAEVEYSNLSIEESETKQRIITKEKIRLKGSKVGEENNQQWNSNFQSNQCEKCSIIKESVVKTMAQINTYVETMNEKLNQVFHKTSNSKKVNNDNADLLSFDYYHTMYYSDLDKLKCGSEITSLVRQLLVSRVSIKERC